MRTFVVLGMMNSGTNITRRLLDAFGRDVRYLETGVWKHTTCRDDIESIAAADLVFVCLRHPLLVIHSTLERPHVLSCSSVRSPAEIIPNIKKAGDERHRKRFDNMVQYFNESMDFYAELTRRLGDRCVVVEYERLLCDPDACLVVTRGAGWGLATPAKQKMGHVGADEALAKAGRKGTLLSPDDVAFVASELVANPFYGASCVRSG